MEELTGDAGARHILERESASIVEVELPDDGFQNRQGSGDIGQRCHVTKAQSRQRDEAEVEQLAVLSGLARGHREVRQRAGIEEEEGGRLAAQAAEGLGAAWETLPWQR